MNARVVPFLLMVAAVMALNACEGTSPTEANRPICHDDTTLVNLGLPGGSVILMRLIWDADTTQCRTV